MTQIFAFKDSFKTLLCLPLPSSSNLQVPTTQLTTPSSIVPQKKHTHIIFRPSLAPFSSATQYAVGSYHNLERLDLSSCHKIYDVILPEDIVNGENYFSLTWSELICGNCEREGKKCRLKSNVGKEPETECIDKPAKGTIWIHSSNQSASSVLF